LADGERAAIRTALVQAGGRICGIGWAAEILGLKPTTLHAKIEKLKISRSPGKAGRRSSTPQQ